MDPITQAWYASNLQRVTHGSDEPHLIDLISTTRGWAPLQPGETMTVTYRGST